MTPPFGQDDKSLNTAIKRHGRNMPLGSASIHCVTLAQHLSLSGSQLPHLQPEGVE